MSGLNAFRERGEKMLKRWGAEMSQGEGKPNILAMADHVPGTGEGAVPVGIGPMFTPLAELADRMLHDLAKLDKGMVDYLVAYAMGLSLTDMSRTFSGSRSKINIELEAALSAWTMAVYYQAKKGG